MDNHMILLIHPTLGGLATLSALWVFVDTLNASEASWSRVKKVSILCAVLIWLTYFSGGFWYVRYYYVDKPFIQGGPWSAGHGFFMETKEHVFLMLLLLATYLPIAASNNISASKPARKILLWVSGLIVPVSLSMEGSGAVVSVAVKLGLLLKATQGG
jgi:hypothetical protein